MAVFEDRKKEMESIHRMMMGETPLEELTEELVKELIEKGTPEKDLEFMKEMGMRYNRERDSFV